MNEPHSYTKEEFDEMVGVAFARLPENIREQVQNVAILVEDVPSEPVREDLALESLTELLGLYQGVPKTDRDNDAPPLLPDSVTLYKLALEEEAFNSGKDIENLIYETLWHELGHHFGHDEEGIQKREEEEFGE
ncbi:MAG: metallopeptidase family protein [Candidatus Pacebacteria bacterium]|nr:metallopeptidase family protein [Candidatus Paceibacterota bacterium]